MYNALTRARLRHAAVANGEAADAGFTLIELMVVLLIMAILLAIAIPTFLGVKGGAQDRSAQSNADSALKEALAVYGNNGQTWSGVVGSNTAFQNAGPEFTWSNDSSGNDTTLGSGTNLVSSASSKSTISYWVGDAATSGDYQALVLAAYSSSGTCWYVANLQATATNPVASDATSFTYTSGAVRPGTYYAQQQNASDCQASMAIDPYNWGSSWGSATNNVAPPTTTTTTAPTCSGSSPCISSVSPSTASAAGGATITITGINFSSQGGCPPACSSWVTVGGSYGGVVSWSSTSVVITVPSGTAGPATINLATHLGAGTSNSTLFSYT